MRVWETSQQAFCGAKHATGYPVAMLATQKELQKGRERSLPHKVLRLMEQENPKNDVD